jgi:hypothetical protein
MSVRSIDMGSGDWLGIFSMCPHLDQAKNQHAQSKRAKEDVHIPQILEKT